MTVMAVFSIVGTFRPDETSGMNQRAIHPGYQSNSQSSKCRFHSLGFPIPQGLGDIPGYSKIETWYISLRVITP
jgi:hypothetical protein